MGKDIIIQIVQIVSHLPKKESNGNVQDKDFQLSSQRTFEIVIDFHSLPYSDHIQTMMTL